MHWKSIVAALCLFVPFPAAAQDAPRPGNAAEPRALALQSGADPDAVCYAGVTYIATLADQLGEEQRRQARVFRNAVPYYAGLLASRYADDELPAILAAGRREFERRDRAETAGACADVVTATLRRLNAATTP
ncbi:MAG: hypothetical protein ACOY45_07560 [Pseudomonadota bacterium]